MFRVRLSLVALLALPLVAGCRIEDRTPTGTRRDEDAIRSVITTYYRAGSANRWSVERGVLWDSLSAAVRPVPNAAWVDVEGAAPYVAYLARTWGALPPGELGPRLIRTDVRQAGGLATVWATVRHNEQLPSGAVREVGRIDHFVLRQIGGGWRIVHLVSVPDPLDERP